MNPHSDLPFHARQERAQPDPFHDRQFSELLAELQWARDLRQAVEASARAVESFDSDAVRAWLTAPGEGGAFALVVPGEWAECAHRIGEVDGARWYNRYSSGDALVRVGDRSLWAVTRTRSVAGLPVDRAWATQGVLRGGGAETNDLLDEVAARLQRRGLLERLVAANRKRGGPQL